ncbi:MAG: hemerythrin domain-containing protein [Bacteroidia bacterium]|nr:hemerythrin domain-containing protein [Bacteroidia bacterium]
MKATQQLKDEHEGIKLMLNIMEKIYTGIETGDELNIVHFEKIIDFIRGFADKCHHGKEEDIFFPALVDHGIPNEGGPIAVMLYEHQVGRGHIKSLSNAFEEFKGGNKSAISNIISSSRNYVQLLRNHIEKENNILFMMADKVLNEEEQSKIYNAFEKLEIEKIGIGKHEEYHHLLNELKSIYLK